MAARWPWLVVAAVFAAPFVAALAVKPSPKRPFGQPDDETGDDIDHDVDDEYERPKLPADEGECLILGRRHARYTFGPYRVCLTPNQRKTLFGRGRREKLGCGVFACAYGTGSKTKVVKFTRDAEDVAALQKAQKLGVVPKIHAVYRLKDDGHSIPKGEPTPVYALVVDRLKTLPPAEQEALAPDIMDVVDLVNAVEPDIDDFCDEHGGCGPIVRQTAEAALKLRDAGIDWRDIHPGNIGLDAKGNVKVLDLGITGTQLTRAPRVLAEAARRLAKHDLGSL